MKEKEKSATQVYKANYIPPLLHVIEIEMECGIAAASATILPVNVSNQVQEDWTDGTDETNDVPW